MKAKEVARIFEKFAPINIGLQSDRDEGWLGFRFGDPEIEISGLGVAWFLSLEVIHEAIEKGLNMLLIHEPHLFYRNDVPWHTCLKEEENPVNIQKKSCWKKTEYAFTRLIQIGTWNRPWGCSRPSPGQ